jgi:hypothetical protein
MSSQPKWVLLANLGDVNPVDYGGFFVYRDETGVYPEEAELLEAPDDDSGTWEVRRVVLERCTYVNGVLSDNKFHPDFPAWFAEPESERAERPQDTTYLRNVAECCGVEVEALIEMFCSADPVERAQAYRMVGDYHGWDNLDSYPLTFTDRAEVESRYAAERGR